MMIFEVLLTVFVAVAVFLLIRYIADRLADGYEIAREAEQLGKPHRTPPKKP